MAFIPWIEGPFDALWRGTETSDFPRCSKFELNLADCLEAYGRHHLKRKCIDYFDDHQECVFRFKQNMRVFIMRQERMRQFQAGEREKQFAPGPIHDAY